MCDAIVFLTSYSPEDGNWTLSLNNGQDGPLLSSDDIYVHVSSTFFNSSSGGLVLQAVEHTSGNKQVYATREDCSIP